MRKMQVDKKETQYKVTREYKNKYSYKELVARIIRSHIEK